MIFSINLLHWRITMGMKDRGGKKPPKTWGRGSLPMSVLKASVRMWKMEDYFCLASGNMLVQTQEMVLPCRWHSSGLRDSPQLKLPFCTQKTWDLPKNIKQQFRFRKFVHLNQITCQAALRGILLLVLRWQGTGGWGCTSRLSWHFWFLLTNWDIYHVAYLWGISFFCDFRVQCRGTQAVQGLINTR